MTKDELLTVRSTVAVRARGNSSGSRRSRSVPVRSARWRRSWGRGGRSRRTAAISAGGDGDDNAAARHIGSSRRRRSRSGVVPSGGSRDSYRRRRRSGATIAIALGRGESKKLKKEDNAAERAGGLRE